MLVSSVGLNFYGVIWRDHSAASPIVGHEFVGLLNGSKFEQKWQNDSKETLTIVNNTFVYFPDVRSIRARVAAAKAWGCGLSVWELGQGTKELPEEL